MRKETGRKKFLRTFHAVRVFNPSVPALKKNSNKIESVKLGLFEPNSSNKDDQYHGSFHQAMYPIMIVAQLFAILPVQNIKSKNPDDLYFSWKSLRTIYSIITCVVMGIYTAITIFWSLSGKVTFDRIVPIIFYSSNTLTLFYFIILAKRWPQLMKQWSDVERQLPPFGNLMEKRRLGFRLKLIAFTIISLSLTEHLLVISTTLFRPSYCPPRLRPVRDFLYASSNQLFFITEYSHFKGVIGKLINVLSTFAWSFMDLFVMLISVGLSTRFTQINKCLFRVKSKPVNEEFWTEIRTGYRQLCSLCNTIDDAIAVITMVSFSNNLYFICVQLLNSLNPQPSFVHAVYFWFSLLYLIGRTLAVSLYSAEINSESKKPLEIFRAVPRDSWCIEVKRFSDEVINDTVALSGMKFFYLTRGLVLSVAGTIVTYELVLIQFHQDENIVKSSYC